MGVINPTYNDRVRYTLQSKESGSITITEPIGWRTDGKEFVRNKKLHGVFTKFSSNLKFIGNGASYIKLIYQLYGIESDIRLIRDEKHPKTDVWTRSYDGYLDLSTYSIQKNQISVKFNSSGLQQILKSRQSEKVEIERVTSLDGEIIPPLATKTTQLDGSEIFLFSSLEGQPEVVPETRISSDAANYYTQDTAFPMKIVDNSDPERLQNLTPDTNTVTSRIFYGINDRTKRVKIKFNGSFTIRTRNIKRLRYGLERIQVFLTIYRDDEDYNYKKDYLIYNDPTPASWTTRNATVSLEEEIELLEGESMSLYFHVGAATGWAGLRNGHYDHDFENCEGTLSIQENSVFEPTASKFIFPHELGNRLVEIMTGDSNSFVSDSLGRTDLGYDTDGIGALTATACGHWIRGFDALPINEDNKYKPFTTSFKDFSESYSAIYGLGTGIEKVGYKEKIVFNDLKYFYQNTATIKLPNKVKKLKRSVAKEYYYSAIEVGYNKGWENEEAMGLDEYISKARYTTSTARLKKDFTQISKYIAASYAKEFIRRKPKEKFSTEDHSNDKEIFLIDLKETADGYKERLWQDDFEIRPKGVYNPDSAKNLRLTPLNMILRHGWNIGSSLIKHPNKKIVFASSESNSNLSLKLKGGKEYKESGEVLNTELGRVRFVPEWIEFEHEVDFDTNQALEGTTLIKGKKIPNVYGLVEFINDENKTERGFLFSLKPNGAGKWKVLKANR